MPFIELPVDVILSVTAFLSYVEIASLIRVSQSLAHLLLPYLYNPILKSARTPHNPYYGLPWPSWTDYIGRWRSLAILNYFYETPVQNLQYIGMHRASLIHLAARENNFELVEVLVQKGFDLNNRDYFGRSPLHYALDYNQEDMAHFLLDAGADVMQAKGYSLLIAAENCSLDIVERIIEQMETVESPFRLLQFTGFSMDSTVQTIKNLALNAATIRESGAIANLLLGYGADPNWQMKSDLAIEIFRRCTLGMKL
ncbi:ndufs2, NADH ubiquinone oxidoreductase 49 kd subunit [Talaromyces marneffei ATCC 18224]|uniref:Ankyrin repeat-containing protein, putative n=2 Tax=Talaromyces marneffei TaxID=37727 RepID=B6QVV7_TALMQ|nr:uncharacterized protein EYB26_009951 [Talaromyces marneffei]EEA19204.1 ankyrin repeat-containing protein, putative [Talaromyces marneffei ATCC 18224]KAE8548893.1 hypothetical protein EYB25_009276 [Talaromyces marneffei]QGA22235.1 hypothetical protein EYB26_009951 [Talaromyces marneffei]